MKKKFLVGLLASVVAVGGAVGASAFSDSLSGNQASKAKVESEADKVVSVDTKTMISADELHDIVLGEVNGTIVEIELDSEGDRVYFEVEVKKGKVEYEVYVDAYTGKVLKIEKDDQDDRDDRNEKKNNQAVNETKKNNNTKATTPKVESKKVNDDDDDDDDDDDRKESNQAKKATIQSKVSKKETTNKKSEIISREEAINIALSLAPGKVEEVELDEDDGRLYYEIEIEMDGDKEAEIEIDARTGKVIEFELDV